MRWALGLLLLALGCASEPAAPATSSGGAGGSSSAGSPTTGGDPSTSAGSGGAGGVPSQAGTGGAAAGSSSDAGSGGAADTGGSAGSAGAAGSGGGGPYWVGTWASSQQITEMANLPPAPGLSGNTLRQVVRVSRGGSTLRLRLSNEFGTSALVLSSVHVATSLGASAIEPATDAALRFGGAAEVTIAPGQVALSDPFDFALEPLQKVAISIHIASQSGDVTGHPGSRTTSFLQTNDAVSAASLPSAATTDHWYFISGIDVVADAESGALVVLGDSITDGRGSTTNQNNRWPDILAERLQGDPSTARIGVLNAAIGGNAVLANGIGPVAVDRFDRDVLGQSGVRWLIVLEGINDIGPNGTNEVASDLIEAYQSFIAKARQAGVRTYGATLLPVAGSIYAASESARSTVNQWIRTSGEFDAVIDLDAVVRDPMMPTRLLSGYDSGDGLHPSPAGHRKLGEAVDLALFSP